jgi:hypothetical protein
MTAIVSKDGSGRVILPSGGGNHDTMRFDPAGNIIEFKHQDGTKRPPHTTVEIRGGKKVRMDWDSK